MSISSTSQATLSLPAIASSLAYCPEWIIGGEFIKTPEDTLLKYLLTTPHYVYDTMKPLELTVNRVGDLLTHLMVCAQKTKTKAENILSNAEDFSEIVRGKKIARQAEQTLSKTKDLAKKERFNNLAQDILDPIQEMREELAQLTNDESLNQEINTLPAFGKKGSHPVRDIILVNAFNEKNIFSSPPDQLDHDTVKLLKTLSQPAGNNFNLNLFDQAFPFTQVLWCNIEIDKLRQQLKTGTNHGIYTVFALIDESYLRPELTSSYQSLAGNLDTSLGIYSAQLIQYRLAGLSQPDLKQKINSMKKV